MMAAASSSLSPAAKDACAVLAAMTPQWPWRQKPREAGNHHGRRVPYSRGAALSRYHARMAEHAPLSAVTSSTPPAEKWPPPPPSVRLTKRDCQVTPRSAFSRMATARPHM